MTLSSETVQPFATVTLHAFLSARSECPRTPVEAHGGFLHIAVSQDVEPHSPLLWSYHPDDDYWESLRGFGVVSSAGDYTLKAKLPTSQLYIDDAYGAIGQ
jgi:hypothetical protein